MLSLTALLLFGASAAKEEGARGQDKPAAGGQEQRVFKPGELWPDSRGVHINAHGGGIFTEGDTHYWFGQYMIEGPAGNAAQVGVSCYSSKDLYTWKSEGIAYRSWPKAQAALSRRAACWNGLK
jgi:hypothetical protein